MLPLPSRSQPAYWLLRFASYTSGCHCECCWYDRRLDFLFGVVLGCVIGWSIAILHSGLPRKLDAVAPAALLD